MEQYPTPVPMGGVTRKISRTLGLWKHDKAKEAQ